MGTQVYLYCPIARGCMCTGDAVGGDPGSGFTL